MNVSEEKERPKDYEVSHTQEVVCPYCGEEQSDSWEFSDSGETECGYCGIEFSYERIIDITYSSQPICECKHAQGYHKYVTNPPKYTEESYNECRHTNRIFATSDGGVLDKPIDTKCDCKKFKWLDEVKVSNEA